MPSSLATFATWPPDSSTRRTASALNSAVNRRRGRRSLDPDMDTPIRAHSPQGRCPSNRGNLRILAEWDQGHYPTGTEIKDTDLAALPLTGHDWHPEWNYDLLPPSRQQPAN